MHSRTNELMNSLKEAFMKLFIGCVLVVCVIVGIAVLAAVALSSEVEADDEDKERLS